jgi:hypothetical protein
VKGKDHKVAETIMNKYRADLGSVWYSVGWWIRCQIEFEVFGKISGGSNS